MKLTIIGASGHGRVVADIAVLCGYEEVEFLDDDPSINNCGRWPVVGGSSLAQSVENDLFIAIGNAKIRKKMMEGSSDKKFPALIHPKAVVSPEAAVGSGTVVMAGAVVNPGARVGKGCIINTCASVDHDCMIEDFVHVSVGAHIAGAVRIGERTWIGAGATVSNSIAISQDCVIGAGAVVINDIEIKGVYIGMPARIMDKSKISWGGDFSAHIMYNFGPSKAAVLYHGEQRRRGA